MKSEIAVEVDCGYLSYTHMIVVIPQKREGIQDEILFISV